jgi:hypothetical protein
MASLPSQQITIDGQLFKILFNAKSSRRIQIFTDTFHCRKHVIVHPFLYFTFNLFSSFPNQNKKSMKVSIFSRATNKAQQHIAANPENHMTDTYILISKCVESKSSNINFLSTVFNSFKYEIYCLVGTSLEIKYPADEGKSRCFFGLLDFDDGEVDFLSGFFFGSIKVFRFLDQ